MTWRLKTRMRTHFRIILLIAAVFYFILTTVVQSPETSYATESSPGSRQLLSDDRSLPRALSDDELKKGWVALHMFGILYLFVGLAVVCDEYFVPVLEVIVEKLNLECDVAGATFMAAGTSAPELATSLVGILVFKDQIGFGTIVGSAVFNILIIIGCCGLFSKGTISVTFWPLTRDSIFYILSLIVVALFFNIITPGKIEWWESIICILIYIGYVILMKNNKNLHGRYKKYLRKKEQEKELKKMGTHAALMKQISEDESRSALQILKRHRLNYWYGFRGDQRPGLQSLLTSEDIIHTAGIKIVARIPGDVHETFNQIDTDGDGMLQKNELKRLLSDLGKEVTDQQLDELMNSIDLDKSGDIDIEEFQEWYRRSELWVQNQLKEAYEKIDTKNDSKIDREEFTAFFNEYYESKGESPPNAEEIEKIRSKLDSNGDGFIYPSEFNTWYETEIYWEQFGEAAEGPSFEFPKGLRARIMFILLAPLTYSLHITMPNVRKKSSEKYWPLAFFMSIFWIGVYSFFMVDWTERIGAIYGVDEVLMGMTLLAAGTSIPDLITAVIVARNGEGDMAVSSAIGSNIFDILLGLGLPWFLYFCIYGEAAPSTAEGLMYSIFLLIGQLFLVVLMIWGAKWRLTKLISFLMILLYGVFVAINLLFIH